MRAVDASAYTGAIAETVWPALRQSGIEEFIPQIWGGPYGANPYLAQHVRGAQAAGLLIRSGYVWPPSRWQDAIAHWTAQLPDVRLVVLWLDDEAGARATKEQADAIRAGGIRAGVYGNFPTLNEAAAWADDLWLAGYPGWQNWPSSPHEQPYNLNSYARKKLRVWQWQGTTTLLDEQFDLNVVDDSWHPEKEADMVQLKLIREEGKPEIYLCAGGLLIHVPDMEALEAQGWKLDDVEVLPPGHRLLRLPVLLTGGPR